MKNIVFVCYGNICRSTMAEFLFKKKVNDLGVAKDFNIWSRATSGYESGLPVHRGTRKILDRLNIDYSGKVSVKLTQEDYEKADFVIGMDSDNIINILGIVGKDKANKVCKLMDFTNTKIDIPDPYWTGDFEETYRLISKGLDGLYEKIK